MNLIQQELEKSKEKMLTTIPGTDLVSLSQENAAIVEAMIQNDSAEVKIPTARPVDISRMNAETLDMELEKGYADMQAGRAKSAAQAFADASSVL